MVRAVVFHYNSDVRGRVVDAFRHAGFITYDAIDPQHALTAVWTYRPQVVITDFPAILDDGAQSRSLTQAIRETPALSDIAIISLSGDRPSTSAKKAADAGTNATLSCSTPAAEIIRAAYELSRGARTVDGNSE